MKALVLAAGEGTRLRPHTADRPKPMVPIAGVPVIDFALAWLSRHGVSDVAINLHYKPESLVAHVGSGEQFGLRVTYSHEAELLGSAGALRPLQEYFSSAPEFVVLYGDILTDFDLRKAVERHRSARADLTIVLTTVDDPTRAGIVEVDADDRVRRFVEKPAPNEVFSSWANAGVYVCGPRVLEFVPDAQPRDFGRHVIPAMLKDDSLVLGVRTDALVVDIGSPERMNEASLLARRGAFGPLPANSSC